MNTYTKAEMSCWFSGKYSEWIKVYDPTKELPKNLFSCAADAEEEHVYSVNEKCFTFLRDLRYPLTHDDMVLLAQNDRLESLDWLRSGHNGYTLDHCVLKTAIICCHHDLTRMYIDETYNENTYIHAAMTGNWRTIQNLINQGVPKDVNACVVAVMFKRHKCFQFLCENDFPLTPIVCEVAAGNNNLKCLKLARKYGCAWDERTTNKAAQYSFDCFKYAIKYGCPCYDDICSTIAVRGNLNMLIWAYLHGFSLSVYAAMEAAVNRHKNVLKWLVEHGCPYEDEYVIKYVKSDKELSQWFIDNNYEFENDLLYEEPEPEPEITIIKRKKPQTTT